MVENLKKLGVSVILSERVVQWPDSLEIFDGRLKALITSAGRRTSAEMVLPCTGQKPHTEPMAALGPQLISPTRSRIRVRPTQQVDNSLPGLEGIEDLSHIFACGDCAGTGAIQAGHTAYLQGQQAAESIVRLIAMRMGLKNGPLGEYKPTHPAIRVTLGRVSSVLPKSPCLWTRDRSGAQNTLQCRGNQDYGSRRRGPFQFDYVVREAEFPARRRSLTIDRQSHNVAHLPYTD